MEMGMKTNSKWYYGVQVELVLRSKLVVRFRWISLDGQRWLGLTSRWNCAADGWPNWNGQGIEWCGHVAWVCTDLGIWLKRLLLRPVMPGMIEVSFRCCYDPNEIQMAGAGAGWRHLAGQSGLGSQTLNRWRSLKVQASEWCCWLRKSLLVDWALEDKYLMGFILDSFAVP